MAMLLKNGEKFSGCEIIAKCGSGAFGITYLARDPIGRTIVIKVITSLQHSEREMKGIRNYMKVSGKHPGLLRIFHVGKTDEGFYYIMEAADDCGKNGKYTPATLGNLFRQGKKFTPDEAVSITRNLLSALKLMHEENLIHRDIKPDNIIFVNGQAKLSDPGLVIEVGQSASFAGTFGFIPPETASGEKETDQKDDLYALGKVFYCMITGCPPRKYPQLPKDMKPEICRQVYPALTRMCNQNPKKRFRSSDEFLEGLPEKLEKPTPLEKLRGDFRDWRILNREKYRAALTALFLVCFGATTVSAALAAKEYLSMKKNGEWRKTVEAFLKLNENRPGLTEFQIMVYLPGQLKRYRDLIDGLNSAKKEARWQQAAETCGTLKRFLEDAAVKLMPPVPEQQKTLKDDYTASGAAHSFLATPLSAYLSEKTLLDYRKKLETFDSGAFYGRGGPACGKNWNHSNEFALPMIFVPSGAIRMRHSGKIARIPYHFWICKNEMPHEVLTAYLQISPQKSPRSNTPMERAAWNDILFVCFMITEKWKRDGFLPPGYIVRPPTEQEWEFAANNAWLGPDDTPLIERAVIAENSQNRTWPAGTKFPGRLGTVDMYGNVSEIVTPFLPTKQQNSVMVRGGSYRSKEKNCFEQMEYLKIQCIPDTIGFRPVVAPGTMDYFDREFFLSGPQQCRAQGKIYELFGGNLGSFDWETSKELCELLGGKLAEFQNNEHLKAVCRGVPLIRNWPVFVGGKKIDGEWRWLGSGKKIDFGIFRKSRESGENNYLMLYISGWAPVNKYKGPLFLCEWEEKEFDRRNEHLKSGKKLPRELIRFSWKNRSFMLIDSGMIWSSAYRFCELLGGRLACLDEPELRSFVIEKLDPYRDSKILLGGYAKRNEWFWLTGEKAGLDLRKKEMGQIPSRNRNFIVLENGKFYDSQFSDLFLCEFGPDSFSSNSL